MRAKLVLTALLACLVMASVQAAVGPEVAAAPDLHSALSDAQWEQLGQSVDRALGWISTKQLANGAFGTDTTPGSGEAAAQPALTSLCVMAYLSRGHIPGYGPYGESLNRAIDFVVSCQMPDGLFSYEAPEGEFHVPGSAEGNATYNHAIAGLMLGEVYGHVTGQRMREVKQAIAKALGFTRALQMRHKENPEDFGGWRYLQLQYGFGQGGAASAPDSDMSVTAWQLMFLRSARNAEFNVPQQYIDDAMTYVHNSFDQEEGGVFDYVLSGPQQRSYSRGLVGAGIVSLSLAGEHQTAMAKLAGQWLIEHPFVEFGERVGGGGRAGGDRFYYSTYYCSQAAAQLGGRYWQQIFPPLADVLMNAQNSDGSWPIAANNGRAGLGRQFAGQAPQIQGFMPQGRRGRGWGDAWIGPVYPTAMAVLSLTPAYQLLPVYQR